MNAVDIKTLRKQLGLSAERFARLTGTSTGRTVRRWEAGQAPVPRSVVLLLQSLDAVPGMKKYLSDASDLGLTA
jgi:DNA-binding transcriptional regulator YiaG